MTVRSDVPFGRLGLTKAYRLGGGIRGEDSVARTGVIELESERVTKQLRDDIIDGVRRPGSRLVERELAAELGVSRLPVREALKALIAEGLVTQGPRSWAVVREFTPTDIADLDEVRSALEVFTFRLAAQRHTRTGLAQLRENVDAELDAARCGGRCSRQTGRCRFPRDSHFYGGR